MNKSKKSTNLKQQAAGVANTLDALTRRRIPSAFTLFRLRHPLIAIRLLIPGLFIGLVGGACLIYTSDHSQLPVHAAGNPANIFVSSNGSDTGANCKRFATAQTDPDSGGTSLCATFAQAYQLASPGDIVAVEAGNYPGQSMSGTKGGDAGCNGNSGGNTSGCVTFQPDGGASVTLDSLDEEASYVKVTGINITTGWDTANSTCSSPSGPWTAAVPTDVIFQNVTASHFTIDGGNNTAVLGGSYGPYTDHSSIVQTCGTLSAGQDPSNTLISGVAMHDYHWVTAGVHMECIHVEGGSGGLIIQKSSFMNCGIFDVLLSPISAQPLANITIQNNVFDEARGMNDATSGGSSTMGMGTLSNSSIKFNTFVGGIADEGAQSCGTSNYSYSNVQILGNLFAGSMSSCSASEQAGVGITASYNVSGTGGVDYGANSTMADNQINNATIGAEDWRLVSGAVAANFVPAASCPSTDYNGQTRNVADGYCAAGAEEFASSGGSDTTPPTVSWTVPVNGDSVGGQLDNSNCQVNATDNVGVDHVSFYLDGSLLNTATQAPWSCFWNTASATNGSSHTLKATAFDAAGNSSSSSVTVTVNNSAADTTPPTVPTSTTQSGATTSTISISWSASTDNVGVAGYRIYLNGALNGTTTATNYTITNLSCGSTYTVGLTSYDAAGNASDIAYDQGPMSTSACAASPPPSSPPASSPPASVPGDCSGDGHVDLTDLSILLSHFNGSYGPADFNGDGKVDLTDLSILLSNFGK